MKLTKIQTKFAISQFFYYKKKGSSRQTLNYAITTVSENYKRLKKSWNLNDLKA